MNFVYVPVGSSSSQSPFNASFTLAIQNGATSPIDTLSGFAIDIGTAHAEGQLSFGCGGISSKAAVPGGGRSPTIKGSVSQYYFNFECFDSNDAQFAPAAPPATYSGPITLTLKGTLVDSTPFTATAVGMKQ